MTHQIKINGLKFNKAFYRPKEPVQMTLLVESHLNKTEYITLIVKISHLIYVVEEIQDAFWMEPGAKQIELMWTPPPEAPKGYGVDVCFHSKSGESLDCISRGFDVLKKWTETPRYGFLSDFAVDRDDVLQTMDMINQFHINGLQFYDWMYRHDQYFADTEPYRDLLNRELSLDTVEALIAAAHERNIAAMPYTAIYAASIGFFEQNQDWALYRKDGTPHFFGDNFLVYMDPRPDSLWIEYLLDQFDQILNRLPFDGIHLDQYGDPKDGYEQSGNKFSLDEPLAETIDLTKRLVLEHHTDGAVVFNAVTNWPIETVAPSNQDFVYIEVWPPYVWFDDLHTLITGAQTLGGGKPVVLAAYIDPDFEYNVRLIDAIIFASGGGHIELGEGNAMLADPYFPKYKLMTPDLADIVQRYYDFTIRYQDIIGPRSKNITPELAGNIVIDRVSTSLSQRKNKVWPIIRESNEFLGINLINMLGVDTVEWAEDIESSPLFLGATEVRLEGINSQVEGIWFASPDTENLSPIPLDYQQKDGNFVSFEIPFLEYWGLVIVKFVGSQDDSL